MATRGILSPIRTARPMERFVTTAIGETTSAGNANLKKHSRSCFARDMQKKIAQTKANELKPEYIFCIDGENDIHCKIGGVDVTATIDSGSKHNIVCMDTWEEWKLKNIVVTEMSKSTNKNFKTYGNHSLSVIGRNAEIDGGKTKARARFFVTKEPGKTLIGSDTSKELGILLLIITQSIRSRVRPGRSAPSKDL